MKRVFLSSTAFDLEAHRKAVDDTLLRLHAETRVMERFGPLSGAPPAECERLARDCDVTVCLVAHRYGHVPDRADMRSITRREVEAARAAGRTVLVWMVDDTLAWTGVKESDRLNDPNVMADPARVAEVLADIRALQAFKAWLQKEYGVERFTTPDDLAKRVAVAISNLFRDATPSAPAPQPEVRVVHALQPAPRFAGRERLVEELAAWVHDVASPDRVWALVAPGGTGKTAVIEQVLRRPPATGSTLVWSFYEKPDADAFLREAGQLFLGEGPDAPPGGRLERLERGLRDGKPHLLVLDGLERVQAEAGNGRARGELEDHTLKLLLRALAAGLGRARALVTSRFPLVDLADWDRRGFRDTRLDDLPPEAAVAVLRRWGVKGTDAALVAAAEQLGRHALSVDVLGSYLHHFTDRNVSNVEAFELDAVTGDDPKAAKLARVIASYAERLPADERELLARLSVFPRGVEVGILRVLVDAGGAVAGVLVGCRDARLVQLLERLRTRGLVFRYGAGAAVTWTAHPFLRDRFRRLLGVPQKQVFEAVRAHLAGGLEARPANPPREKEVLDRYEALIEAARLAGRTQEAFDLYWHGMGRYANLGAALGDYARGLRILRAFSETEEPEDAAPDLHLRTRNLLVADWALYALRLGDLGGARRARAVDDAWKARLAEPKETAIGLENTSEVLLTAGALPAARRAAEAAVAQETEDAFREVVGRAFLAAAAHRVGDIAAARAGFAKATRLEGKLLYSLRGEQHARHHLDLGDLPAANALCDHGLATAKRHGWNDEVARFHSLLARITVLEGGDPAPHLDIVREWTARSGDMEYIIEAHLVAAEHALRDGDPTLARDEAALGLNHAAAAGYGLLHVDALVLLARAALALPDPAAAIAHVRDALDRASHPECAYAWGEADAAQVWGEAYLANNEPTLARRALERALAVRRRIEHPGVPETERWLARVR